VFKYFHSPRPKTFVARAASPGRPHHLGPLWPTWRMPPLCSFTSHTELVAPPDCATVPRATPRLYPCPTNPTPCRPAPPRVLTTSPRPIAHHMQPKLKREGNEIDFDLNLVNGSQNPRFEIQTLMAHVFGNRSTSSLAWSTYKTALVDPSHLFSSTR
jgi:hypothetical protein